MRVVQASVFIGIFLAVVSSFGQNASRRAEPPFKPVAAVGDIMRGIVDPLSCAVFASVGTVSSAEGIKEIAPESDKEWERIRAAAMGVAEAGNLLMFDIRSRDRQPSWMEMSKLLVERAVVAANAAAARNADELFDAGSELFAVCESCHSQHMPYDKWILWRTPKRISPSINSSEVCR